MPKNRENQTSQNTYEKKVSMKGKLGTENLSLDESYEAQCNKVDEMI